MVIITKNGDINQRTELRSFHNAKCVMNDLVNGYKLGTSKANFDGTTNDQIPKIDNFTLPEYSLGKIYKRGEDTFSMAFEKDKVVKRDAQPDVYIATVFSDHMRADVAKDKNPLKFARKLQPLGFWLDPNNLELDKEYESDNGIYKLVISKGDANTPTRKIGTERAVAVKEKGKDVISLEKPPEEAVIEKNELYKSLTKQISETFAVIFLSSIKNVPFRLMNVTPQLQGRLTPVLLRGGSKTAIKINEQYKITYWLYSDKFVFMVKDEDGKWFYNPYFETETREYKILKEFLKAQPLELK